MAKNTRVQLKVSDENLEFTSSPNIYSGDVNTIEIQFGFDEYWDNYVKYAVFYTDVDNPYTEKLSDEGVCMIPHEVMEEPGRVYIGVFGSQIGDDEARLKTSEVVFYDIGQGIFGKASRDTANMWQEILIHYDEIRNLHADTVEKAQTATQQANEATQQAQEATEQAQEATEQAQASADSASEASTSEQNAKTSETNAKASETASKASADASKISETNAKTSETNASESAQNASESASEASASAESANSAKTSAESARDEAMLYRTQAQQAAQTAANEAAEQVEDSISILETATGEYVGVTDSGDEVLYGLKLYGKSVQDGTPSTSAPVEIESVPGTFELTCGGKNLLKIAEAEPGELSVNGTVDHLDEYMHVPHIPLRKKAEIVFSSRTKAEDVSNVPVSITRYDADNSRINYSETTLGKPSGETIWRGNFDPFEQNENVDNVTLSWRVKTEDGVETGLSDLQLEYGGYRDITDYEPYKGFTNLELSLTAPLLGVPVTSDGNYTDEDGQMWISDEVNFATGKVTRRVAKIDSYNSEDVGEHYISTTGELTAGATVVYALSEPTEEDIPESAMSAYNALKLVDGTTMFYTNADVEPGIEVRYRNNRQLGNDVVEVIDKKVEGLQVEAPVTSVNGQTGDVVLTMDDLGIDGETLCLNINMNTIIVNWSTSLFIKQLEMHFPDEWNGKKALITIGPIFTQQDDTGTFGIKYRIGNSEDIENVSPVLLQNNTTTDMFCKRLLIDIPVDAQDYVFELGFNKVSGKTRVTGYNVNAISLN